MTFMGISFFKHLAVIMLEKLKYLLAEKIRNFAFLLDPNENVNNNIFTKM